MTVPRKFVKKELKELIKRDKKILEDLQRI